MIPLEKFYCYCDRLHFLFALTLVLMSNTVFNQLVTTVVSVGLLIWAAWKEFYWDERYESEEERGSGFRDFKFYGYGVMCGWSLIAIKTFF